MGGITHRSATRVLLGCLAMVLLATGISAAKQVKLTVVGSTEDLYQDEWTKVNPDIQLNLIGGDGSVTYQQVAVMMAAGDAPDLLRVNAADIPWLLRMGMLEDLTPYIQKAPGLRDLLPVNDLYKVDGKQYAINKDWSIDNMLWYNKDILNRVGLAQPGVTQSLSFQNLMQQAKKIDTANDPKAATKIFGLWTGDYPENFQAMVSATGQPLYTKDFLHTTFTTNEAIGAVAAWWWEMFTRGWGTGSGDHFVEGHAGYALIGYYFGGHPASANLRANDSLGVAITPDWNGSRAGYCYGVGYAIVKGSKNKDEAFKYLEWMTTGKPAEIRTAQGWGAPPVQHLLNKLPQETQIDKQRYQALIYMMPYLKPFPANPFSTSAVGDAAFPPRKAAQNNEISLQEFLIKWQQATDTALLDAAGPAAK